MIKTQTLVRALILAALPAAMPAFAAPILTDGTWYSFLFRGVGPNATGGASGSGYSSPGSPPWTFTAGPGGLVLTVTDGYLQGDVFRVLDFGVPAGTTSATPPDNANSCFDDPNACLADPLMSHGAFAMGPGDHSILIRATVSPFSGGTGFFRVEPASAIPEPGTWFLLAPALAGLALCLRRRRN